MMKKVLFRALAVVGGCLVSLLLAELVLKVSNIWIGRHSDTMFTVIEYDGILGWKMKPNIHEKVDLVDVEGIPVRSNSEGFWDNEFVLQKPLHRCRIAFLGDSFTWGMGVREEERFTNLVAAANPEWESLNFGLPGYGTDQSLLLWQHIAHRYQPDLVILTIYQNDYVDNMYVVRYGRRKPYFELKEGEKLELRNVPVDPTNFWNDGIYNQAAPPYVSFFQVPIQKRSRIVHWLVKNSNLARFSYTVFRANNRRAPVEAQEESRKSRYENLPGSNTVGSSKSEPALAQQMQVSLLGALVEQLAEQVEAAGAGFAVVFSGEPILQYRLQQEAFSNGRIAYLDATTEVLANRLPDDRMQVYYPLSKHWSPAAHRVVADLVAKSIREQALCTERK